MDAHMTTLTLTLTFPQHSHVNTLRQTSPVKTHVPSRPCTVIKANKCARNITSKGLSLTPFPRTIFPEKLKAEDSLKYPSS